MLTSNGTARLAVPRHVRRPTLRLVWPEQLARLPEAEGRQWLATVERREYERLPSEGRRHDWLAGRIAAKLAVRDAVRRRGLAPTLRSIVLGNDRSGAPTFTVGTVSDGELGLNLSIAHAAGAGVAAVADTARCGAVGVDVEPERPLARDCLRAILTRHEWRAFGMSDSATMPSPLQLWMLKEAVFKADRGETFGSPFDVELRWHAGRVAVRWPASRVARARYRFSWRSLRGVVVCCVVRRLPERN